jgi:hypothetical protein
MLLQGDEGYYSREVEFQGDKFRIREMTETERAGAEALNDELLQLQREQNELLRREKAGDNLTDADYNRMNAIGREAQALRRQHIDLIVAAGVVGWSDKRECTPEAVVLLPPMTKTFLAREVDKDSVLGYAEADFLPLPRTP